MSLTPSNMLPLGTHAPDFTLVDVASGQTASPQDANAKPLLVVFMCNHCPYVVHLLSRLVRVIHDYQRRGIHCIAISANDINTHPQDAPAKMKALAQAHAFEFPYCFDETQATARAYEAACTPDFFLFDHSHQLVYRGQFDASRPGNDVPITGIDLTQAMDLLLNNQPIPDQQTPSIGCNIKWKS